MAMRPEIRVQREDFDVTEEVRRMTNARTDVGAVVTFCGLCRDDGGSLSALELEHYPGMAEAQMRRIAEEAGERWLLSGLTAVHRFGLIRPGENIVLVVAASMHRQAAFDGANFMMDYLKTSAPFWKKEHLLSGASGSWVEAKDTDDAALRRWRGSAAD
ncbi:molybdenum cofactor biosynthesis protein MoaE [Pararhizobium haloflavum]|uniref:molybdenum cofactor biosynthesis protein MoaE n=1 Tax=Pararhizobium haloflavum TaxID=2037914 RepID=UPI000C18D7D2|nr:molybdenum cofactor biosynthesis protein MoaE [Pararhizobium haloflavum]